MGNSDSLLSKRKVVVRNLKKKKQVIIDTNNDLELELDENIENKLLVKLSGVRDVIGKTIYDRYPTGFSIYACVDSGEMKKMSRDRYRCEEEAKITLDKSVGGALLKIEIYQHHNPALDIGTSDGVMIFGRCRVPVPKVYSLQFNYKVEVVNIIEGELRVIGKIGVELEKRWIRKSAMHEYYNPAGMYYRQRGVSYPILAPPSGNDHNKGELHALPACEDITHASSSLVSRLCKVFSARFFFARKSSKEVHYTPARMYRRPGIYYPILAPPSGNDHNNDEFNALY